VWDGRLVSRDLISINHKLRCVVQFTNGKDRTLSKYAKIEYVICQCANLNKEETRKMANGRVVCVLFSTNAFLETDPPWLCGLMCGYATASFLGLRVRNLPKARISVLVSVVCCQTEVCASGRPLVQRSPTECSCFLSLSVIRCNNNYLHVP
jgi:hypothetical protein